MYQQLALEYYKSRKGLSDRVMTDTNRRRFLAAAMAAFAAVTLSAQTTQLDLATQAKRASAGGLVDCQGVRTSPSLPNVKVAFHGYTIRLSTTFSRGATPTLGAT